MLTLMGAPEKGTIYALYTDKVIYKPNSVIGCEIDDNNLLELHIYDEEKEFRFIRSQRGDIQKIIDDQTVKHDDLYEEIVFTDTGKGMKTAIVNYICYDETDSLYISNYRLKEVR